MVDVKLLQLRPCSLREVLVWLEGLICLFGKSVLFDVVKDAIPAYNGSLYFVHVLLLICLDIGTLLQCVFVINRAVALPKWFDFRNMECGVSLPFVGER